MWSIYVSHGSALT